MNKLTKEDLLDIFPNFLHTVTFAMDNEPNIPNAQVIFKADLPMVADAIIKAQESHD